MYEPQGPLPREVYVRRRVAAVVVALVVIALVVGALYLASRDDGTDTSEAASTSQSAQPGAGPTSTGSGAPASSSPAAASRGRCDDNDLAVQVWPANANFTTGAQMRFFAQIRNTSSTPCDRELVGAPLAFEVYRLDDNSKVWSSVDCTAPQGEDKVVFQPNAPVARQIDWSGRISAQGACSDAARTPAGVGSYQVYALVGKVFSPAATFNVVK